MDLLLVSKSLAAIQGKLVSIAQIIISSITRFLCINITISITNTMINIISKFWIYTTIVLSVISDCGERVDNTRGL